MEWGGEHEDTMASQASLIPGVVPALAVVLLIIVALFNADSLHCMEQVLLQNADNADGRVSHRYLKRSREMPFERLLR